VVGNSIQEWTCCSTLLFYLLTFVWTSFLWRSLSALSLLTWLRLLSWIFIDDYGRFHHHQLITLLFSTMKHISLFRVLNVLESRSAHIKRFFLAGWSSYNLYVFAEFAHVFNHFLMTIWIRGLSEATNLNSARFNYGAYFLLLFWRLHFLGWRRVLLLIIVLLQDSLEHLIYLVIDCGSIINFDTFANFCFMHLLGFIDAWHHLRQISLRADNFALGCKHPSNLLHQQLLRLRWQRIGYLLKSVCIYNVDRRLFFCWEHQRWL